MFLLSLSLLIVLHELGHFLPAKAFKTRVEKFYLFFDVKYSLFKKKIGDTVYGIGWLPLGGYVKIAGMIDESMDTEQMAQPPQPWEFRSKPAWQRLIIMLGGVTVNFLVALFIYIIASFSYGDADISTASIRDGYWVTNPVITELGVQTGDNLVSIDGEQYENYSDLRRSIITAESFVVERDGQQIEIDLRSAGPDVARTLIVDTSSTDDYADSRAFYARRGFVEEARIRDYYGPDEHRVVFWKSLV